MEILGCHVKELGLGSHQRAYVDKNLGVLEISPGFSVGGESIRVHTGGVEIDKQVVRIVGRALSLSGNILKPCAGFGIWVNVKAQY